MSKAMFELKIRRILDQLNRVHRVILSGRVTPMPRHKPHIQDLQKLRLIRPWRPDDGVIQICEYGSPFLGWTRTKTGERVLGFLHDTKGHKYKNSNVPKGMTNGGWSK